MKKIKLSLSVTILLATIILGGFYYATQISKQRSIEKQQRVEIEQNQQERLEKQQTKEDSEQALNTCIANAEENYSKRWDKECKRLGKLTSKCIDINELSYMEYLKKYELTEEEYEKQREITDDSIMAGFLDYFTRRNNECSCRLPTYTADDFEDYKDKLKADCFKRYPQK